MLSLIPTFDGKRTVPSPRVTEIMLEMLKLTPKDKLLEIGTGSGTQTQAFAATGAEIHSVEVEPWLGEVDLDGKTNVYLHAGDGIEGIAHEAPFSAIVATCGVSQVPDAWKRQLADRGSLVAPVGDATAQRLILFRKFGGELVPQRIAAYVKFQMLRAKPEVKELKPVYKEQQ